MRELNIESDEEHARLLKELERLIERNDAEDPEDSDRIRELAVAIEKYEKKKFTHLTREYDGRVPKAPKSGIVTQVASFGIGVAMGALGAAFVAAATVFAIGGGTATAAVAIAAAGLVALVGGGVSAMLESRAGAKVRTSSTSTISGVFAGMAAAGALSYAILQNDIPSPHAAAAELAIEDHDKASPAAVNELDRNATDELGRDAAIDNSKPEIGAGTSAVPRPEERPKKQPWNKPGGEKKLGEKSLLAQHSSEPFSTAADEDYDFKANRGADRTAAPAQSREETIQKAEPVIENTPGQR